MGKQTVIHPDDRILFRIKMNELSDHGKTWRTFKYIFLSEQTSLNNFLHSVTGSTVNTLKGSVVPVGWGGGQREGRICEARGIFLE